jgi:hypothetical protein
LRPWLVGPLPVGQLQPGSLTVSRRIAEAERTSASMLYWLPMERSVLARLSGLACDAHWGLLLSDQEAWRR